MDDDHLQAKQRAMLRMIQTGGFTFSGFTPKRVTLEELEAQELVKVRSERSVRDIQDVADQAAATVTQAQAKAVESMSQAEQIVGSAALVTRNRSRWETIKTDLREASRNGLSKAAKVGRNKWNETAALAWADTKGKLNKPKKMADLPGKLNKLPW